MEKILQELIKTTLEKGPQNKQFYSNLSITKPIHDHAEIQVGLSDAVAFLKSKLVPGKGFQSSLYTSRNCAISCACVDSSLSFPENTVEILTSVLALDLLFNESEDEQFIAPKFQQIVCNFSEETRDSLHNLIVPTFGLSTFNLFKQVQPSSSVPSSPSPVHNHQNEQLCNDDFDSGNDSPISMQSSGSNPHDSLNTANILNEFPDDINTSMLTLHVLLHQGIIQSKPVESVLRWMISNVFTLENENFDGAADSSSEEEEKPVEVTFPTFITRQGSSDPMGVVNLLNLMYLLDISHEELLNAAEEFLVMTLVDTLTAINAEEATKTTNSLFETTSAASSSSAVVNSLGNTYTIISSDGNGQKPAASQQSCRNEEEALQQQQHFSFVLQHHSPDSLLYFLSRAIAMNNGHSAHCSSNRRPYISQMRSLLLDLLDARLGTTMNTCDLAMRILAGVYLGAVMVSTNNATNLNSSSNNNTIITSSRHHQREMLQVQENERYCSLTALPCDAAKISRINNLLQKEFELLVSLQNDADGSWQADSIVQVGFRENVKANLDNSGAAADVVESCSNDGIIESQPLENEVLTVGYLGGKELATLFAIKAISAYLSKKKGTFECDERENWYDMERQNRHEADVEIHQLY